MKKLTGSEARALRAKGTKMDAVTLIGKRGLTDENIKIIKQAFTKSSLVKISINKNAFEDRKAGAIKIAEQFSAILVQQLGSSLLLLQVDQDED